MLLRSALATALATFTLVPLAACLDADGKGDESDVPEDGKLDSFRSPTYHGPIGFDARVVSELTAEHKFHTWDFYLTDDAQLTINTAPQTSNGRKVDTVLYLYKESERGWGSYLARNDDANGKVWSELRRSLGAGHYRVLVKGYDVATAGKFAVTAACAGAGCVPPPVACLLGDTFSTWRETATIWGTRRLTSADQLVDLSPTERDQIVLAAHQSSHDDVTTAEEALARFDSGEVNLIEGTTADHWVQAVEYGAGDNSYGAIFYGNTLDLAASIQDGDLYGCTLLPPVGGAAIGETCTASSDCPTGSRCEGISGGRGVCAPQGSVASDGQECSTDASCGAGALCFGLTQGYGLCGPAWHRGTFDDVSAAAIPDGGALSTHLTAYGLTTVSTDVSLRLQITHADRRQLEIYLRNPAGTEVLAWDGATATASTSLTLDQVVVGFPGDESVNGSWVLRVVDGTAGGAGALTSWGLTLGSRWD